MFSVNRLKEETGVVINVGEENGPSSNIIRIEGNREGVFSVKKKLQEKVQQLENETEKTINVENRLFPILIGAKGSKIQEIRDTHKKVLITFYSSGIFQNV